MSKLCSCTKCKKKKQVNEFYLHANGKPREICKSCWSSINKEYYIENSDKIRTNRSKYYSENKEEESLKMKKYYESNKESFLEYSAKRRATKRNSCPSWLSPKHRSEIKSLYKMAKNITEKTGNIHHVDHIVPLTNEFVCGLHVPWNLQILPASENLSKHNKLIVEDMVCSLEKSKVSEGIE